VADATSYAFCRALDPGTGDVRLAGATWAAGTPMTEVVLRVLRTPRGRYLPDPDFGVDYDVVQKLGPGTAAAWRAEVLRALRPYVDAGLLADVAVTVDTGAGRLVYQVDFTDPRAAQRLSTGRQVF
jgi:hypothetical protein